MDAGFVRSPAADALFAGGGAHLDRHAGGRLRERAGGRRTVGEDGFADNQDFRQARFKRAEALERLVPLVAVNGDAGFEALADDAGGAGQLEL